MVRVKYKENTQEFSPELTLEKPDGSDAPVGGKNQSRYKGRYRVVESDKEFFVKKPRDIKEFFAELFAGLIIEEMKQQHGLLPEPMHELLVCCGYGTIEGGPDNGKPVLVQPYKGYTEFYKIMDSARSDGHDRSALYEIFHGNQVYSDYIQQVTSSGLPTLLLISLLIGDHSVHSGNVVCDDKVDGLGRVVSRTFGRYDFGAAFRHFNHANNGLFTPHEYSGFSCFKYITKNYISYYQKIPGLMSEVAATASILKTKLTTERLLEIVKSAYAKLPPNWLSNSQHREIAAYLSIPAFARAKNSEKHKNAFCRAIAKNMFNRLQALENQSDPEVDGKHHLPEFSQANLIENCCTLLKSLKKCQQQYQDFTMPEDSLIPLLFPPGFKHYRMLRHFLNVKFRFSEHPRPCNIKLSQLNQLIALIEKKIQQHYCQEFSDIIAKEPITDRQYIKLTILHKIRMNEQSAAQTQDQFLEKLNAVNDDNNLTLLALKTLLNKNIASETLLKFLSSGEPDDIEKRAKAILKISQLTIANNIRALLTEEMISQPDCVEILASQYDAKAPPFRVDDIIKLVKYKNKMLQQNKGYNYKQQVLALYAASLPIYMNNYTSEQAHCRLKRAASNHLIHRHLALRLIADILLTASCFVGIGLAIGLIRCCALDKPFYLSTEKTKRHQALEEHMAKPAVFATA